MKKLYMFLILAPLLSNCLHAHESEDNSEEYTAECAPAPVIINLSVSNTTDARARNTIATATAAAVAQQKVPAREQLKPATGSSILSTIKTGATFAILAGIVIASPTPLTYILCGYCYAQATQE